MKTIMERFRNKDRLKTNKHWKLNKTFFCYLNFFHLFGDVLDLLVEVLLRGRDVLLDVVPGPDVDDLNKNINDQTDWKWRL